MSLFRVGQPVIVQHQKPWKPGKPILLRGTAAFFDGNCLVVERHFKHPGQIYDGLPATQHHGDHGTIELHRDAWVCRRRYLRENGELIGELYNIQTPTQFVSDGAVYVDLEIDVAYIPHVRERVETQDVRELAAAVRNHFIPEETARMARQIAEDLAERLERWDGRSEPDWDVRPEETSSTPCLLGLARRWPGFLKVPRYRAA